MKTKIIFITALMLMGLNLNAQTKYYQSETIYPVGNNTLKTTIKENAGTIILHDANAIFVNVKQTSRNGGSVPGDLAMRIVAPFTSTKEMFTRAKEIVKESLSIQSKELTKGRSLVVNLIFNPDTGKVTEVHLSFGKRSPFTFVPPAEYYTIITKLKNEISVQMTEKGRDLNFASSVWMYKSE